MTQFDSSNIGTIPQLLKDLAAQGLRRVHLATEPGEVACGVARYYATDPLLIVVLRGRAGYHVRRGGAAVRLDVEAGEALLACQGAGVGVSPREPYVSLGARLLAKQTYAYVMRPATGAPDSSAALVAPWLPENTAADDSPFTHGEHLARQSSTATSPAVRLALEALASEPQRAPEDPWRCAMAVALLQGIRGLLEAPPEPTATRARRSFDLVRAAIDRDFDQPISRETVASHLGLHPHHVTKLFAQFADETFGQYLMRTRLDRGLHLLTRSGVSVKQAAAASGFASTAYFTACFRRRFGAPPARYRDAVAASAHDTAPGLGTANGVPRPAGGD